MIKKHCMNLSYKTALPANMALSLAKNTLACIFINPIGTPVIIVCCTLRDADMNSKLLDNFSYDLIEVLVKYFFEFLPTIFRKLTSNDINSRIFSIEKMKKITFSFFRY